MSNDEEEELGDFCGYTGIKIRNFSELEPFSYQEFIELLKKENKIAKIFKTIRDIDQENNGYVTNTELEDIIKMHFPQLIKKKFKLMFKPFASIQNQILIDYRIMKEDLVQILGIDLEDEKKRAYDVHPHKHIQPEIKNISSKRKKTKLNSLTLGNLAIIGKD